MISVFDYTDYRLFLKDLFDFKKISEGYTYRDFAKAAKSNSPSWLSQLIKGSRNLSPKSALRVSEALGLKKSETNYFTTLVKFYHGKNSTDKDDSYREMLEIKKRLNLINITDDEYEFYDKWYHPVIRSLISKINFKDDFAELAKKVLPNIKPGEAKKSVLLLEKLGYIEKTKSGWKQNKAILTTGDKISSLNIVKYHKIVSKLAAEAHDRTHKSTRDISAVTVGIDKKRFEKIKTEIQAFRKKILQLAEESDDPDRVYQVNLQLFPVSIVEGDKDE